MIISKTIETCFCMLVLLSNMRTYHELGAYVELKVSKLKHYEKMNIEFRFLTGKSI